MDDWPAGVIHALQLDGTGGAGAVSWDEVLAWRPGEGCLWVHLHLDEPEARAWLEEASGLNDIAVDGLLMEETRPRVLTRGSNLLLTLRGINLNPGEDPEDMVSLRLWSDGERIISVRRRRLQSTEDLLALLQRGDGPVSAVELLVAWLDRLVDRMGDSIEGFEDAALALEEDLIANETGQLRGAVALLRKRTISVRRYLAPQREALARLTAEPLTWIGELDRLRLREIADRQVRLVEAIDELRERAAVAHDELAARLSEQLNARMYLLSLVAALFLPLGFFTGLMGINVGGMPGVDSDIAFWFVAGGCAVAAALVLLAFRLRRWL
ncbi:zinc transporter ZntB [Pseudohaliea rubra]|uniref:Magnesium and cobalt transport protein CorA n=1 Tax=Pseudohaliea rubra DSM 19751 TaxID=1265313 RepID=A0A095XTP9_9GAMM|nr:zinc transporter ZntB [Pseudohaliea rubra]KGE03031.1 Magnesium and cobalt transport protein CorA [Pseudohaliea rubra DSM 19751]